MTILDSWGFFYTNLPAILPVHPPGECHERLRGTAVRESSPVFQPQGVGEVEQGDHGHDASREEAVDLLVVVIDSRLLRPDGGGGGDAV